MLRRYEEARAAVDRTQHMNGFAEPGSNAVAGGSGSGSGSGSRSASGPIPYDDLYPAAPPAAPPAAAPAPTHGGSSKGQYVSAMDEKERARRYYEAQDAVARVQSPYMNGASLDAYTSPPPPVPFSPPTMAGGSSALSEKEILRRKFEADDAAALHAQSAGPPVPPLRASGYAPAPPPPRGYNPRGSLRAALPTPGGSAGGSQPLTAAEEKARLKAQYEAEDAAAASSSSAVPPPPPLMPRPPREYVRETLEEDARNSQLGHPDVGAGAGAGGAQFDLGIRPFTPFTPGFGQLEVGAPPPPPPLPPKLS